MNNNFSDVKVLAKPLNCGLILELPADKTLADVVPTVNLSIVNDISCLKISVSRESKGG